jgi:hypothetical protein
MGKKERNWSWVWWPTPVIPQLRKEDLEFKTSLGYIGSSRSAGFIVRSCLKKAKGWAGAMAQVGDCLSQKAKG